MPVNALSIKSIMKNYQSYYHPLNKGKQLRAECDLPNIPRKQCCILCGSKPKGRPV